MKKLFISQPMRGLTDEEILKTREEIKTRAERVIGEPVELINSFIEEYPGEINKSIPVWYLGKSIQFLSEADIAYFGGDWRNARGCKIEHEIASAYEIRIIEESKTEEIFYKIGDIVKFPYGTRFENVETGTIYTMEQQLKILRRSGQYDYPALNEKSFEENYRIIE